MGFYLYKFLWSTHTHIIYAYENFKSIVYLLIGLLVSMWVGLPVKDVAGACNEGVDMLLLVSAKPLLLILPVLSLLTLADTDLHTER